MAEQQKHAGFKTVPLYKEQTLGIAEHSKEQIQLTQWREGEKAPCGMSASYCGAFDGSVLYVR